MSHLPWLPVSRAWKATCGQGRWCGYAWSCGKCRSRPAGKAVTLSTGNCECRHFAGVHRPREPVQEPSPHGHREDAGQAGPISNRRVTMDMQLGQGDLVSLQRAFCKDFSVIESSMECGRLRCVPQQRCINSHQPRKSLIIHSFTLG